MADDLSNLRSQSITRRVFTEAAPGLNLPSPDPVRIDVPFFQQANVWQSMAEQTKGLQDGLARQEQAEKVLRMAQMENAIDMKALELRDQFAFDPDGFRTAYDKASAEIIKNTESQYHPELQIALDKQFVQSSTIIQNETRSRNLGLTKDSLKNKSTFLAEQLKGMAGAGMAGSDPYKATAAEYRSVLQTSANLGFMAPDDVELEMNILADQSKGEAVIGMLDAMYDQKGPQATQKFFDAYIGDPNNGLPIDQRETLKRRGDARIADKLSASAKATSQTVSNLDLAIEVTEDGGKLTGLVDKIASEVDPYDPVKGNDLRKKVWNKMETQRKEAEDVIAGSMFATGAAYLNPADNENVKKFNTYYEKQVMPLLSKMGPDERNTRLTSLVRTTNMIPDLLKGDIQYAARSLDTNIVAGAADLVNRIDNTNPHLLQDLPEKDLARIRMVDSMVDAGYTSDEAFKRTEELLKPANAEMVSQRKQYLKKLVSDKKLDYGAKALRNFQPGILARALPGNSGSVDMSNAPVIGNAGAQLTADYRQAYESHYELVGDEKLSEQHANTMVRGMYGSSNINGFNQLMRYAPEKYYSIENSDNGWMREQLMEQVAPVLNNSMFDPSFDRNKDIILVPDPFVTPRTAAQGAPEYKIMAKTKDGTLVDVLDPGQYFKFDPGEKLQKMIDEAKAKKQSQKDAFKNVPEVIK